MELRKKIIQILLVLRDEIGIFGDDKRMLKEAVQKGVYVDPMIWNFVYQK